MDREQEQELTQIAQRLSVGRGSKHQTHKQREEQAKQAELDLISRLDDIVERIKQEHITDISLLQARYGKEVHDVLRAATTSAFIIGSNYVGARKQRLHHVYVSGHDLEAIVSLTAEYQNVFWRRMNIFLRQFETLPQSRSRMARYVPRSKFNINALVTSLAVKLITKTIAIATIRKVRALKPARGIRSAQAAEVDYFVWRTAMDEKVCPFCNDLEGHAWREDDPDMLVPPDDAHENCRCRLDTETGPSLLGEEGIGEGIEGEGGEEESQPPPEEPEPPEETPTEKIKGLGKSIAPFAPGLLVPFLTLPLTERKKRIDQCVDDSMQADPNLKEEDARKGCEDALNSS